MDAITSLIVVIVGYYAFMFLFNVVIVPLFALLYIVCAYVLHVLHIIRLQ